MRTSRVLAAVFALVFVAFALSTSAARADDTASGAYTSSTAGGAYTTNSVTWCRTC